MCIVCLPYFYQVQRKPEFKEGQYLECCQNLHKISCVDQVISLAFFSHSAFCLRTIRPKYNSLMGRSGPVG